MEDDADFVLAYLPEIESDLSVFHRIDDIWEIYEPWPRFVGTCKLLTAYQGAVSARMTAESDKDSTVKRRQTSLSSALSNTDILDNLRSMGLAAEAIPVGDT